MNDRHGDSPQRETCTDFDPSGFSQSIEVISMFFIRIFSIRVLEILVPSRFFFDLNRFHFRVNDFYQFGVKTHIAIRLKPESVHPFSTLVYSSDASLASSVCSRFTAISFPGNYKFLSSRIHNFTYRRRE